MMKNRAANEQVVYTNKARCRDCYRCIRVCPVNAIGIRQGQAWVDEHRCISCGTCVRECPQGAKTYRRDLEDAKALIRNGEKVAVSIAPSFAAVIEKEYLAKVPTALKQLGFLSASETAVGAYYVAKETAKLIGSHMGRVMISTACPAVVSYVEKYRTELIGNLLPLVSPMLAHAKIIKQKYGEDTKVVFIGPCVGKKAESEEVFAGLVDVAITFDEFEEWLEDAGIDLGVCVDGEFDIKPAGFSRAFPVVGGSSHTASMSTDLLATDVISVSGFEEVLEALDTVKDADPERLLLIEPLFCEQGCINGPAMCKKSTVFKRRKAVLDYVNVSDNAETFDMVEEVKGLEREFITQRVDSGKLITEEQIELVFQRTDKTKVENILDCGACGYSSCKEQAVAVIMGMAESQMCIPYMRRLAEKKADQVIQKSPNGIVILDEHMTILQMNPSFKELFMCNDNVIGKRISYLIDPDPFEKLISGKGDIVEQTVEYEKYGMFCHQIVYALRSEKKYVGVYVNMTNSLLNKQKLDNLRSETLKQAQDLLNHQVEMAGKIAKFLGESTAQGEKLLDNLMGMARDKA